MERVMGFEPTTSCLGSKRSTAELHPHTMFIVVPKETHVKMLMDKKGCSATDINIK
jgi:hypothetical protein